MSIESVNQIMDQFRSALKEDSSDLYSFPDKGNLYAIYRSVALVIQEQNTKLQTINQNLYLDTASGEALDYKALEYNISRSNGAGSSGSVIILGNISSVSANTILTDNNTRLQFQVQDRVSVTNGRGVASVLCTEYTSLGNLPAGTELYNSVYSNVRFIVGSTYDPLLNQYVGSLNGGSSAESDDQLRARVKSTIQNLGLSTLNALKQRAINISGVSKVDIIENEPSIGYITVYIDNSNQQIINKTKIILDRVKPIGTALIVKSFDPVLININLAITTFNNSNLGNLRQRIILALNDYISSITFNNEITTEGIAGSIFNTQGVVNVKVINPTSSISIKKNEIISLGTVNITFK
jgi:uncharacterized phage protein gp47/JayE